MIVNFWRSSPLALGLFGSVQLHLNIISRYGEPGLFYYVRSDVHI